LGNQLGTTTGLNRLVRSRFTPPERSFCKPDTPRVPCNPLNYRAFDIRTKLAVVRLLQRKWAERGGKRPKSAPRAGRRGSDNSQEWPHSAGLRPLIRGGKRMSRLARLADRQELSSKPLCAPGDRQVVADASSVR
jgi:hypothetical protein